MLTALADTGRLDDTVIIFSSDHGDMLGDHGLIGKANFYEGSCRVQMLLRHPRRPGAAGRTVDESTVSLTSRWLRSTQAGHSDLNIADHPLWDDAEFGRPGWERTYPLPLRPR